MASFSRRTLPSLSFKSTKLFFTIFYSKTPTPELVEFSKGLTEANLDPVGAAVSIPAGYPSAPSKLPVIITGLLSRYSLL